jgi:hypothetical protein
MPFTPFHFGPGAALKAAAPRHFSFTVFVFTNVVIDVEPLYYILTDNPPLHRFLHTYAGAAIAAAACGVLGPPVCSWAIRTWNGRLDEAQARWLAVEPRIPPVAAAAGALAAGWSHVLLDSLMHADMQPFAPFFGGGDMTRFVTIGQLELFCVLAGVLGAAALLALAMRRPK